MIGSYQRSTLLWNQPLNGLIIANCMVLLIEWTMNLDIYIQKIHQRQKEYPKFVKLVTNFLTDLSTWKE